MERNESKEKQKLIEKQMHFSNLREAGEIEDAIEGYKSILGLAEEHFFSKTPEMIAVSYRMLDKPEEGLPYARQAVEWAREAGDPVQEGNCRRDLGGIYEDLEDFDKAEEEYKRSLSLLEPELERLGPSLEEVWDRAEDLVNGVAGTYSFMGRLASKTGDYDRAHDMNDKAVEMTAQSKKLNPRHAGQHYLFVLHRAEIFKREGKIDKAVNSANKAMAGFKTLEQDQTYRIKWAEKLIAELQKTS